MDIARLIKDNFSFLIEKKFKCKIIQRNAETEVVFSKETFQLELFIDLSNESLDVVINKGNQRINLVNFSFFEKGKTISIQQAMMLPGLTSKINAISQFISLNMIEIM